MLFGRVDGPRLYLYLAVASREKVLQLLDASTSKPPVAGATPPAFKLVIDKAVTKRFGNVTIGVLEATATSNVNYTEIKKYTNDILKNASYIVGQFDKWEKLFIKMNAPADKQSSVVFLTKHLMEKGKLFNIHPMVDFYNAVSVKYGLPMGAYDTDKVAGVLRLRLAAAGEPFTGIGAKAAEVTQADEVIYADDNGVTCRFWNAKDADRTKITKETTRFVIFFDGVDDAELIKKAQADMECALGAAGFTCKSYIVTA